MKSSQIHLSKEALALNLAFIRKELREGVRLSSVIKGNAYGHGIAQMVPMLEAEGVDHFSVYDSAEARKVHQVCSRASTVMIMGNICAEDYEWVVESGIECYVFNFYRLQRLSRIAAEKGKKVRVHIEVETGMNRTGFEMEDWPQLITELQTNEQLDIQGVCTHFAGAESISNYKRIQQQRRNFRKFVKLLHNAGISPRYRHTSCSAALIGYPNEQWNMVRIGILQYGLWPSRESYISYLTRHDLHEDPLKRVISWYSEVMDIKRVKKDQFIGYGITQLAEKDMVIASVPIGYSDGYSRSLSNKGKVLIRGTRLDVIGIVNMNLILVDVTTLEEVAIGDRVILIGDDNGLSITVVSFGELSYQLNYELLTRLDKDILRIVI